MDNVSIGDEKAIRQIPTIRNLPDDGYRTYLYVLLFIDIEPHSCGTKHAFALHFKKSLTNKNLYVADNGPINHSTFY